MTACSFLNCAPQAARAGLAALAVNNLFKLDWDQLSPKQQRAEIKSMRPSLCTSCSYVYSADQGRLSASNQSADPGSLPSSLSALAHTCTVLIRADSLQATSDMLAEQQHFLPLLHLLEAVSSGSIIGPLAETLLEELQQSGSSGVGQSISQLRAATRAAMKAKALARRKAMLASLNMPSPVCLP